MKETLSIIIPAYNEELRLPKTLLSIQEWCKNNDFCQEVLVVDDGSIDETVLVVEDLQKNFPQLRLLALRKNSGKGAAVKAGMLGAKGEWRLFMDADGSTPAEMINRLWDARESGVVCIGSRYRDPESIKIKQSLKRQIISRIANYFIQSTVLPGIRDTQCGFKLFSSEAVSAIFKKQESLGWLFDVEILTIAQQMGYEIKEIPVDWYDAEQSKVRAIRTSGKLMKELKMIKQKARQGAYTSKDQK